LTGHKVLGGTNHGDSASIRIQPVKGGNEIVLEADRILISTGRRPFTKGLGLEKAGVKINEKGVIQVNGHL